VPLNLGLAEDVDPIPAGGNLEYVLRFGNTGANALLATQLALTLPPGTTVLDAGGGTVAAGTVTWALGALNAGQTGERRVRVSVDDLGAADPLVRVARAVISSSSNTPAAHAAVVTEVQASSLGLVLQATPDPVAPLGVLTYELTVTNHGTADADQVELSMPVPIGSYTCYAVSDGATGSCGEGRYYVWSIGTLPGGTSRTVHFVGAPKLANGAVFLATARVEDALGDRAQAAVSTSVGGTAPLDLALTTDANPVRAGGDLEYVLRFGNTGANALLATQLALTLPPGTTVLDAGGGTVAAGTVTWALGALNAGQTGEHRVRVSVDDLGAGDPLVRVARATIASGASAARAAVATQIQASSLGLVLQATPDPVAQFGLLTYDLTVTNHGTADADQVELRMPVPVGSYNCYVASDGATGSCGEGRDYLWSLGTMPGGTSRTVHFVGAPKLANGAVFLATARVEDALGDRARAAVSTSVDGTAPLDLALTTDANPVRAGGDLEYVLRFGNTGANALLTTQLALTLPTGTTVLDAGGGTVSAGTVTWTLGTIDPAQAGERRVRVSVDDLGAGDLLVRVARAVISSGTTAARAAVVTEVEASPLGLVLQATPDPVAQFGLLTYELTVTNRGAADAVQVELRMAVPTGTYNCYGASDDATGSCAEGRDYVWSLDTMPAGTSRTVHLTVAPKVTSGAIFLGTARVQDASGSYARAATSTAVQDTAPLALALTEGTDPVAAGDDLEYVLRFGNRSTGALLGTQLSLVVSPGMTILDADGGAVAAGAVTWSLGTLDPGENGEHRVRLMVDDLGDADPLVRVGRAVLSSGAAAARASVTTMVQPTTLGLTFQTTPDPVAQFGVLTYLLTVTNNGQSDAVQVELRMFIPDGTYTCGAASDGGTYPSGCRAGADVLWSLGTLASGDTRSVQVILRPTSLPAGSIYSTTARVQDASGARTLAGVSTVVIKP
jgi:uncharacterized repeat protein (TIGR01451 family)